MVHSTKEGPAPAIGAGTYLPAIDSLRAIAVVAVMLFHLDAGWLPGGFTGVDVFLVISGYIISRSMVDLDTRRLRNFLAAFFARRFKRILPALLVCLLVTVVVAGLFIPESWLATTNQQTASYAFWGLSNYFLMHYGDPYFAPRVDFNPYVHTWSLGVEEQFYWLFPAAFYVWLRFRDRAPRVQWSVRILLPALFVASFAYSALVTGTDPATAYYSLPSRFWELAAGALLFQAHTGGVQLSPQGKFPWLLFVSISFGLLVAGLLVASKAAFPFPWAILTTAGTVGLIDALVCRPGAIRWLEWPGMVWTGKLSYSLYLWHWPVYVLFRWTWGLEGAGTRALAVLLTGSAALLSYFLVENPLRRGAFIRKFHPVTIIVAGLCGTAIAWAAAGFLQQNHDRLSLSVTRDKATWYPADSLLTPQNISGPCAPVHSISSFAGGAVHASVRQGCQATNLFVTGNSHAIAYTNMLARLSAEEPYNVYLYYRSECTFVTLNSPYEEESPECREFYRALLKDIGDKGKAGDFLFLPSLRVSRLGDQWARLPAPETIDSALIAESAAYRAAAVAETGKILEAPLAQGLHIVLEAPKPLFRSPAFRCSDWFNRHNPVCADGLVISRQYVLDYRQPMLDAMEKVSRENSGVVVWDPFETLCPETECRAVVDGMPWFFDGDHLSGHGNDVVYPDFLRFLRGTGTPTT